MSKVGDYGSMSGQSLSFGTAATTAATITSGTYSISNIYSTTATVAGAWNYDTKCPECGEYIDDSQEEYILVRIPAKMPNPEAMTLWHVPCYAASLIDFEVK